MPFLMVLCQKTMNQHMYNQLSLESSKKEPQICKGFEDLERGIRVCNDGCLQDELTSTTSSIWRVCWTWRCVVEFEGRTWWPSSIRMSLHWKRLSALILFCFFYQQNVLAFPIWIFILEAFHHSPFSTVHIPIWYYAMWHCVPHDVSRLLYDTLACRWHLSGAAKRTDGNFPQGLVPGRL